MFLVFVLFRFFGLLTRISLWVVRKRAVGRSSLDGVSGVDVRLESLISTALVVLGVPLPAVTCCLLEYLLLFTHRTNPRSPFSYLRS